MWRSALASRLVEHLTEPDRVAVELDRPARRHRRTATPRRSPSGQRRHGVGGQRAEGTGFAVQHELAGVAESQRAEVLDEAVERPGLVEQQVEVGVVAGVDAIELQPRSRLATR